MKTLQELYAEIVGSDELKKVFSEAAKDGKVTEFLKAQGCEATEEEISVFLKEKADQELSDDELDSVAGGKCGESITTEQWKDLFVSISKRGLDCPISPR